MSSQQQEFEEKIANMNAWQLAQLSVVFKVLEELSKEDFAAFHDIVCNDGVPILEAAARFGVEIMLDEFLSDVA